MRVVVRTFSLPVVVTSSGGTSLCHQALGLGLGLKIVLFVNVMADCFTFGQPD